MSSSWICKHHAQKLHVNIHGLCSILFLWILQSFQSVWWSPLHAWHTNPAFINIQGHFCQYWCPCNENDCSTNLVSKLMDQAFVALDLKKKNTSTSWTFGSWIDAAAVHSIRSGIKSREWNSVLSRILKKRFWYPLTSSENSEKASWRNLNFPPLPLEWWSLFNVLLAFYSCHMPSSWSN